MNQARIETESATGVFSVRRSNCTEENVKTQDIAKNEMTRWAARFGKTSLVVLLAVSLLAARAQAQPATPPADPAHSKHVAAGAVAPDAARGDPALSQQISELQAKIAQLEAALARNAPHPSAPAAGAMPGMAAPAAPAAPMTGMSGNASAAMKPAGGMGGMPEPPGGAMSMMDKKMAMMQMMMGTMDKMMSMGGSAMPAGAPMSAGGMDMDDKMEMAAMGGGAMAGGPAAGMSGGGSIGMDMDQMEMAGMMGMGPIGGGAVGAMTQSMLPGFPGASHLYHIGATDFFLDHPRHIALTTDQQAALNKAKEQALLAKSTADRAIKQAEQELWTLTAADQPDATAIEAKITEIGKLTGDERLAFIRAVGDASKILTDEQRRILTGFAQPAPAAPVAPAMSPGGMKDM